MKNCLTALDQMYQTTLDLLGLTRYPNKCFFMQDLGAKVIKELTNIHFRRKLETRLLSQTKGVVQHSQRQMTASSSSRTEAIH